MQNWDNWINSNGNLNHLNGSSFKVWFPNGQLFFKEYCINGKLHNEKGPAYRYWDDNYFEEYWLEGEEVDKSTFEKL